MKDIFCKLLETKSLDIILENEYFVCIKDKFPQDNTHLLIISKQHLYSFLSPEFEYIHNHFFPFVKQIMEYTKLTRSQLILNSTFHQEIDHFHAHIRSDEYI